MTATTTAQITIGSRVSDAGHREGTVRTIAPNAIGRDVAECETDTGETFIQVVELLTWTGGARKATELKAGADFVKSYSSPFGKAAKKAYIEQYGAEPAKTGLDVRGHRLVRVHAYTVAVLEKATARYARTAALAEAA